MVNIALYLYLVSVVVVLLGWNSFYNNKDCRRYQAALYNSLGQHSVTAENFDKQKNIYHAIAIQTTVVCLIPVINVLAFYGALRQASRWINAQKDLK